MVLTTKNDIELDQYFGGNPPFIGCCNNNSKTRWWHLTPYDTQETIYWIIKHLTLPGVGVSFIIAMIIINHFDNPVYETVNHVLGIIGGFMLLSVFREYIRGKIHRIKEDNQKCEIKAKEEYNIGEEEDEFTFILNQIKKPHKYVIGFVGDIMMMKKFDLQFHQEIRTFFQDVDLIVGNLEGIVSINTKKPPCTKQRHVIPFMLDKLEKLSINKTEWLLCLSNNHSADFGNNKFHNSLNVIQNRKKFNMFGRNDVANVFVKNKEINLASGSEWSNQDNFECISWYRERKISRRKRCANQNYINNFYSDGKLNILFPHWGYENEKYVRLRVQKDAIALLTGKPQNYSVTQRIIRFVFRKKIRHNPNIKWDFIFGHHPHVRQPIMKVKDKIINSNKQELDYNRLVVFSGGNFTSGANIIRKKKHIYGIIMKCKIGPLKEYPEKIAIGEVKWRRTVNNKEKTRNSQNRKIKLKEVCVHRDKYFTYNRYFFIFGLIVIGIYGFLLLINWFI